MGDVQLRADIASYVQNVSTMTANLNKLINQMTVQPEEARLHTLKRMKSLVSQVEHARVLYDSVITECESFKEDALLAHSMQRVRMSFYVHQNELFVAVGAALYNSEGAPSTDGT